MSLVHRVRTRLNRAEAPLHHRNPDWCWPVLLRRAGVRRTRRRRKLPGFQSHHADRRATTHAESPCRLRDPAGGDQGRPGGRRARPGRPTYRGRSPVSTARCWTRSTPSSASSRTSTWTSSSPGRAARGHPRSRPHRVLRRRPDAVVVQGDTTTTFVAASPPSTTGAGRPPGGGAADQRPLRPFPEEINRRLTSQLAALHLAPTALAGEPAGGGRPAPDVVVTGNTVIDALLDVVAPRPTAENPALEVLDGGPAVLVTSHRRESWGQPMARTAAAIARLAKEFATCAFVLPAHLNPVVREVLLPPLAGLANVVVTEPLAYGDFCRAMACRHPDPDRQRRGAGGGAEPRQAGAGHARDHRAPRGGGRRHRAPRRHRRGR